MSLHAFPLNFRDDCRAMWTEYVLASPTIGRLEIGAGAPFDGLISILGNEDVSFKERVKYWSGNVHLGEADVVVILGFKLWLPK